VQRINLKVSPRNDITQRAIELFRACRQLEEEDDIERWEEQGGVRRQYMNLEMELYTELGLAVWDDSPNELSADPRVYALRCALQDAI
jgi:hypothetical protein